VAFAAAPPTPLVGVDDPAREDRPARLEPLADDFQAKVIDPGDVVKSGQPKPASGAASGTLKRPRWVV